jgi:lipopolysaccharide transport system ATP-binding protein
MSLSHLAKPTARHENPKNGGDKDVAINVDGVSKLYRLGSKERRRENVANVIVDFVRSPLRNYRYYRSLYDFRDVLNRPESEQDDSPDVLWALREVSFQVKRGEALGVIGSNGAGKSTLLKILSRITPPTAGEARISGRVSSLLEVGTGFHPELTGRENIYLNGTILGMKKKEIDKKFEEIVEFSGVQRFLDTPVKRYSSGMTVRLAFSVAAHLEPDILIVDEVLAVGDAAFQRKCLGKMEEVTKEGRTVLFVSHNMGAIANLCNSAIWLDAGRLASQGDVSSIVSSYLATSSNLSVKDPEDWKREGTGEARISDARILDSTGNRRDRFGMGESILFEFDTQIYSDHQTLPDDIVVLINRVDIGLPVLHLSNLDSAFLTSGLMRGNYTFRVELPECLLYPGTYSVSVYVAGFDYVRDVLSFSMEQSDVSSRTCPFYKDLGIYHSPSNWKMIRSD